MDVSILAQFCVLGRKESHNNYPSKVKGDCISSLLEYVGCMSSTSIVDVLPMAPSELGMLIWIKYGSRLISLVYIKVQFLFGFMYHDSLQITVHDSFT